MVKSKFSRRASGTADRGLSLIELVVATSILAIFLTVLTTSLVSLSRAAGSAQVVATSANGVLSVFQNLDRDVRYADSVNFPGAGASGVRYVEFRVPAKSSPTNVTTCTQWAYDPTAKTLMSRSWDDGAGSTSVKFSTKLTYVLDAGTATTYPFQLTAASPTASSMQILKLKLDAGNTDQTAGAGIETSFVARNSSVESPSNASTIIANKSDSPVCQFTGSRP